MRIFITLLSIVMVALLACSVNYENPISNSQPQHNDQDNLAIMDFSVSGHAILYGDTLVLSIEIENVYEMAEISFEVVYDKSIFSNASLSIPESNILGPAPSYSFQDIEAGTLVNIKKAASETDYQASNSGLICRILLKAIYVGHTSLCIRNTTILDGTGQIILFEWEVKDR